MTNPDLPAKEGEEITFSGHNDPKIIGNFSPEQSRKIRERQIERSKVMGLILFALCVLFFAITIVKIGVWG